MTDNEFDLTIMECEACRRGAPTVSDDEAAALMLQIPGWQQHEVDQVPRLGRTFSFDGWMPAVAFANKIAEAAEENDHHPLIELEWGKVTVNWWTHKIKGLHKNDFIMAAKTSRLYDAAAGMGIADR